MALPAHLSERLGDAALAEIHLFAYLACLLSLYQGRPVAEWGYSFAATRAGHPFSADLHQATEAHIAQGLLLGEGGIDDLVPTVRLTDRGRAEFKALRTLQTLQERDIVLQGASDSLLSLPTGTVRTALSHGVDLRGTQTLGQKRLLLTERSRGLLYDEFDVLSRVLPRSSDVMVPSVLWLTYLADAAKGAIGPTLPATAPPAHG